MFCEGRLVATPREHRIESDSVMYNRAREYGIGLHDNMTRNDI